MIKQSVKQNTTSLIRRRLRNAKRKTKDRNVSTMPRGGTKTQSSTIAFLVTKKPWPYISENIRPATESLMNKNASQTRTDGSLISLRSVILHVKALQRKSDKPQLRSARKHSEEKSVTSALTMLTRLSQQTSRCAIVMKNRKVH
jgi:hypothetical protein